MSRQILSIKIDNETESTQVQEICFRMGYAWFNYENNTPIYEVNFTNKDSLHLFKFTSSRRGVKRLAYGSDSKHQCDITAKEFIKKYDSPLWKVLNE